MGKDLIEAVMEFFTNRKMLRAWNRTAFTLIPKVPVPATMKEFRPLACCNVICNCISKWVLSSLVGQNQSAFISGRDVVDNVIFMQEIVKNYNKVGEEPRCAIKVDLQKAYDTVQW